MSLELHARTRRDLEPDPEFDPICALFYCLTSDSPLPGSDKKHETGAVVLDKDCHSSGQGEQSSLFSLYVLMWKKYKYYYYCACVCVYIYIRAVHVHILLLRS